VINVVSNLDSVEKLLKKRGLEPNGRVQKIFTIQCAKEMDAYVPMSAGASAHMKNQRIIKSDSVTFNHPGARFLYHGKLMIGILSRRSFAQKGERKVVIDRDLTYHGAPKRGPYWDKRMWADKKDKIINDTAIAAGGHAG